MPEVATPDWAQKTQDVPDWAATPAISPRRTPLLNPTGDTSTTKGPPPLQIQTPDWASEGSDFMAEASRPAIKIPKFTIQPTDSKTMAVGKEAVNLLTGIPEFIESPMGIASLATGSVLPKTVATLFGAQALDSAGKQVLQSHKDWDKYTPAQKAAAVTDIAGQVGFAALLGHGVVKSLLAKETAAAGAPLTAKVVEQTISKTPNDLPQPKVEETKKAPAQQPSEVAPGQSSSEPAKPANDLSSPPGEPSTAPAPDGTSKPVLTPALLVDGKPITGGTSHAEIFQNLAKDPNVPVDQLDSAVMALSDDSKHVFVDQAGKVYDRKQAAQALGLKGELHSENLPSQKPSEPVAKEPWKMTKADYSAMVKKEYGMQGFPDLKAKQATDATHAKEVATAVAQGKPVPLEVLTDYPDLQPKPDVKVGGESKPFEVDEQVVMHSPHTGDDVTVSYRGKPSDGQAVVWTGKTQMQIPEAWLRHQGEKYVESSANQKPNEILAAKPAETAKPVEPASPESLSKAALVDEYAGAMPSDYSSKVKWENSRKAFGRFTKSELVNRIKTQRKSNEDFRALQERTNLEYPAIDELAKSAGNRWKTAIKERAEQEGVTVPNLANERSDAVYSLAQKIASKKIRDKSTPTPPLAESGKGEVKGEGKSSVTIKVKHPSGEPPFGGGTIEVTGKPVKIPSAPPEFEYVAYKTANGFWKVAEKTTGLTIGNVREKTLKAAVDSAEQISSAVKPEAFRAAVERADKLNVPSETVAKMQSEEADYKARPRKQTGAELNEEWKAQQKAKATQSPSSILDSTENVKVTSMPQGSTMLRVHTESGGKKFAPTVISKADLEKGNVFKGAGVTKVEAGTMSGKVFKPMNGEVTVEPKAVTPISRGPGAAAFGEPGSYSPIQRMADRLQVEAKTDSPIDAQIDAIEKAKTVAADAKDSVKSSASKLVAIKDAMWKKWAGLPEYGDEQKAVGKWFYALQKADAEARNFAKQITKAIPSKLRREAITNWIQADGDVGTLKERAAASKGSIKLGYEAAQSLTPRETEIAQMLRDYYDQQLQNGIDAGILKSGLENYITQVWKRENPITKKLISDLSFSKLQPNFKFARKRMFDSYFEGEQAGFIPNKDAGFLVANYDQSFNKSLAARAFIKDLHEGKASDGRPLVDISGNGRAIGEDEAKQSVLVNPHSKPEELSDYRTIDHPALRGWKWATKTPEGQNVFVKGDMIVHPEAYQKLKNRLSVSAFRQSPVGRAFMNTQTTIKQTMLSLSGFHQVQETLHSLGHRINPVNMPEIDFTDPVTKSLVEHGLQLADYNALDSFSEGLSGGNLTTRIPVIGNKLHAYNEWLFQDYIPRLKLAVAKSSLERNRSTYPNLAEDKQIALASDIANKAFGELPYRYWGRSPTLQDALRTFILAPDFLEARAKFVGRAARPFGREQLSALGILAATQYMVARIVNQMLDDDPHWEMKNAFRIVTGNHAYGLRTIPSDLIHLFSDTRGFLYNRMSPGLRTAVEYTTGRNDMGVKRDVMEQVKDLATMPIPISMKSRNGQKWWEGFMNSFGVQTQRQTPVQTIQSKAADFKQKNNITSPYETVYDSTKDEYQPLRMAIQDGDQKRAQEQFDKLSKTTPPGKIKQHFKDSLLRPFTGSKHNDAKFYDSLDEGGKKEFDEAKDLQRAWLKMVMSLNHE